MLENSGVTAPKVALDVKMCQIKRVKAIDVPKLQKGNSKGKFIK